MAQTRHVARRFRTPRRAVRGCHPDPPRDGADAARRWTGMYRDYLDIPIASHREGITVPELLSGVDFELVGSSRQLTDDPQVVRLFSPLISSASRGF
jgi:hypothetical protein